MFLGSLGVSGLSISDPLTRRWPIRGWSSPGMHPSSTNPRAHPLYPKSTCGFSGGTYGSPLDSSGYPKPCQSSADWTASKPPTTYFNWFTASPPAPASALLHQVLVLLPASSHAPPPCVPDDHLLGGVWIDKQVWAQSCGRCVRGPLTVYKGPLSSMSK